MAIQELEKWTEIDEDGVNTIIGGSFNARTGREVRMVRMEGKVGGEEGREGTRKTGRERERD